MLPRVLLGFNSAMLSVAPRKEPAVATLSSLVVSASIMAHSKTSVVFAFHLFWKSKNPLQVSFSYEEQV